MSFGILRGSDPSKGITGTFCANRGDANRNESTTSSRFMAFLLRRIAAVRRDGLGGSIAAGSLERAPLREQLGEIAQLVPVEVGNEPEIHAVLREVFQIEAVASQPQLGLRFARRRRAGFIPASLRWG
jgi:hypothetical protein